MHEQILVINNHGVVNTINFLSSIKLLGMQYILPWPCYIHQCAVYKANITLKIPIEWTKTTSLLNIQAWHLPFKSTVMQLGMKMNDHIHKTNSNVKSHKCWYYHVSSREWNLRVVVSGLVSTLALMDGWNNLRKSNWSSILVYNQCNQTTQFFEL